MGGRFHPVPSGISETIHGLQLPATPLVPPSRSPRPLAEESRATHGQTPSPSDVRDGPLASAGCRISVTRSGGGFGWLPAGVLPSARSANYGGLGPLPSRAIRAGGPFPPREAGAAITATVGPTSTHYG